MRKTFVGMAVVGALGVAASGDQIFDEDAITLQQDFETEPMNAPPPGSFTLGNATFSENSTGSGGPGWRLLDGLPTRILTDNAGISEITIDFENPVRRAGLLVGIGEATYDVSFFSPGGDLLGVVSGSVQDVADQFFAGWEDAGRIGSIVVTEPTGDNGRVGGIDDLRYDNIPAPGAVSLLGLAGLASLRRRR